MITAETRNVVFAVYTCDGCGAEKTAEGRGSVICGWLLFSQKCCLCPQCVGYLQHIVGKESRPPSAALVKARAKCLQKAVTFLRRSLEALEL